MQGACGKMCRGGSDEAIPNRKRRCTESRRAFGIKWMERMQELWKESRLDMELPFKG